MNQDRIVVAWKRRAGWPRRKQCGSRLEAEILARWLEVGPALDYVQIERTERISDWTTVVKVAPRRSLASGPSLRRVS